MAEGRALRVATGAGFAGIAELDIVADASALSGARALAESKLVPAWDILLSFWFGSDGAFRAGPALADFDRLYDDVARQTEPALLIAKAEAIDRHTKEEASALFLCTPQSLTAVNNHVRFTPYATTFELAEGKALPGHWSLKS